MTTYNEYKLPNLQLLLKRISKASGSDQASYINNGLILVDSHDHTEGKGTRITPEGIDIDADLDMNSYALTNLGAITFTDRSDNAPTQGWFVKAGNFYIRDGADNIIQLTEGNDFIGLDEDIIGGDYDESEAIVYYSSSTGTYSFKSSVNIWANINCGQLTLHDNTLSPTYNCTFKAPDVLSSSYTLRVPSVGVTNNAFWCVYPSGASAFLPEGEDSTTSQVVQLLSDGSLEVGSIKLKNFPSGTAYKGLNYQSDGNLLVNGVDAAIIPNGTEAQRPSEIEGVLRGNTTLDVMEIFLEGEWKKAISIDTAGLSFNDIVDVTIAAPAEGDYLLSTLTGWENGTMPTLDWGDVQSLPDDVTDLSLHTIGELSNVDTTGAAEGNILKWNGTAFAATLDGGEGAVWGHITGDITNQTDLINLLDLYMDKPDATYLTKDVTGTGTNGKLNMLVDVSTNVPSDNDVLVWQDTEFVPQAVTGGTDSPVAAKGDIYIGIAAGVGVLAVDTTDGKILVHKNKVLQWVSTEGMTGGGGKFNAIVLNSPSQSKQLSVFVDTTYKLSVDLTRSAGTVTIGGIGASNITLNSYGTAVDVITPTATNVTFSSGTNFSGEAILTLLPLIEGSV